MYPDGSPSLRYKRPREDEEELPEPVDDDDEEPYEPPEGEGEEDAMSSGSGSTAEAVNNQIAITPFSWSDTTPAEPMTIEVRVSRRTWCWLQTWTLKDVKAMRPCDKKWTKDDQRELLASLKRVLAQPTRVDGEYVYITEKYSPAKNGFPGRLTSAGLQGLQGQIRANLLAETADIDMSMCMHRIVLWVCKQFNIATPQLEYYVRYRDGPNGMLQYVMDNANVTKSKAKELHTMTYTSAKPIYVQNCPRFKAFDKEAKEIQQQLMRVPQLQWILPHCKEDNRPGSFVAHLFQWIECKLVVPVSKAMSAEFNTPTAALVFDGFNLADASLHGNTAALDLAHAVCEQVCPGIDMIWAWKELDFMVKSKDTRQPLKELRVPDSFVEPTVGSPEAAVLSERAILGPNEFTYEDMRTSFSLGLEGSYGKVGSTYIKVEDDGRLTQVGDAKRFIEQHIHKKHWELVETRDEETGVTTTKKVKMFFIQKWMKDERMDPKYLPEEDEDKRYYWDRFDMFPDKTKCPKDVYNLWAGFAAGEMTTDLSDESVRHGLVRILEHFKMLCNANAEHYDFLLDLLAHAVQHPDKKVGIVTCLVGKQGCGKGTVWDIIVRLMGSRGCMHTTKPERDVYGHFNGRMKDAFFVRMAECTKKKLEAEDLKEIITGDKVAVHEKYCPVVEVKSYARFFIDTNRVDAIPDEHGERRYFIIKCDEAMIGHDADYFIPLREEVLADDRVIRALYEFLLARVIRPSYHGPDIPVGEYARALKDSKRSDVEQFLEWLVEQEDMSVKTLHLTAEAFATRYKTFKGEGEDRSTDGIMKQLNLQSIQGVQQQRARPQNLQWCGTHLSYPGAPLQCSFCAIGIPNAENKVMRQYVLDCDSLRARYSIEETVAPSAAPSQPAASIDCEAEVASFCSCPPASDKHCGEGEPSDEALINAAEEAEANCVA